MHINECSIDNPEWSTRIELAVRAAFRKVDFAPTQTDIDTTTNSLCIALAKPLEREEGRREWTSSYLRRTAWFKVLTYLAERLERTKEMEPLLSLDALATDEDGEREGETRMNLHPLYGGVLLGLGGDLDEQLRSAPYEVRFDKDEPEVSMYRRNPYAVPSFHIVERGRVRDQGELAKRADSSARTQRDHLPRSPLSGLPKIALRRLP